MPTYSVSESNSAATTLVSGNLAVGGNFTVLGISEAGSSTQGVGQSFAGTYGSLVLNSNGSFTYTLNNGDPDTNVLGTGVTGLDRFTYTYSANGVTQTSTVIFQVNGVNEPGQVITTTTERVGIEEDYTIGSLEQIRSSNSYGLMVYGEWGRSLDLTINGALLVNTIGANGIGFWGESNGDIFNNGLIDIVGQGATGVSLWMNCTLTNSGVIRVKATGLADPNTGSFPGQARGVEGGPFTNSGTLEVHSAGGMAIGVNSSVVDNSGLIYVSGNASADWVYGISTGATNAVINNSGTLHVVSNGGGMPVGISIFPDNTNVHQYATVNNSGTIVATTAIRAVEGYSSGVHVNNSGRIEGNLLFDHGLNIVTNAANGVWVGNLQLGLDIDAFVNQGAIVGDVFLSGGDDSFDGRGGTVSGVVDGGDGRDLIYGGSAGDRLKGGEGNDRIVGGGGADALEGGAGADVYVYTSVADSTASSQDTITGFQTGIDKLDFSALAPQQVNITMSGSFSIVTATVGTSTLTIKVQGTVVPADLIVLPQTSDTATAGDDFVTPIVGSTYLLGYGGNDVLHGGSQSEWLEGGAGLDVMFGGAGNDIYIIDNDGDRAIELDGGGVDEVRTWVDYSLQGHIENGILLGSNSIGILGNSLDNLLQGNAGSNVLRGAGGNDTIIGGAGFDALEGGRGADRFVYELASDATGPQGDRLVVFEHGIDLIDLSAVSPLSYEFVEMPEASWGMWPWVAFFSHWTQVTITTASGIPMTLWVQGQTTLADFSENAPLSGTSINDVLIGSSAANTISGKGGVDVITGAAGNDTFRDTAADLNGDTITDFTGGDRIVIIDATLAGFSYSLDGNILTYTGGSLTLSSPLHGTIVATAAAGGGVQLTINSDAANDFNGDGRSDIMFRHDNGAITNFLGTANGGILNNGDNVYTVVENAWELAGTGDFNGDGRDDVLWRNSSGAIFNFLGTANGGVQNNGDNSYLQLSASWTVSGVGDFNGDGRDDILFRDANGVIFDYLGTASGGFVANTNNLYTDIGDEWHVSGVGDFNGDGRDDILFRNDNGAITNFLGTANGGIQNNGDNIYTVVGSAWHIAGVGDFNGDGRDDILWRNDNGAVFTFLSTANGGVINNGDNSYAAMSNVWHVEAIGDYNGDGRDDILWRHDNGTIIDWLGTASGGFNDNSGNLYTSIASQWQVAPADPLI